MRAINIAALLLIIVASILIIAAITAPGKIEVQRVVFIKAPPSIVFSQLNSWQAFREWNPWTEADPEMHIETEGREETAESVYRWEGKQVGKGQMRKTFIKPDSIIEYQLIFYQPWGYSVNRGYWLIESDSGGCKVTWGLSGHNSFLFRALRFFFNFKEKIEKDFDRGLKKLKEKTEAIHLQRTARSDKVYEIIYPEKIFMLLRHKKVAYDDLDSFRNITFKQLLTYAARSNNVYSATPHCIFFSRSEEKKFADVGTALPVLQHHGSSDISTQLVIPESRGFATDYFGSYDSINLAHQKLQQRIELFGHTHPQWIIEEYIVRADNQPDTSKWHTRIYYLLR